MNDINYKNILKYFFLCFLGGNIGDMFMIQSKGGALLLARKLKWEVNPFYNLTISVTDGVYTVFTFVSDISIFIMPHSFNFHGFNICQF